MGRRRDRTERAGTPVPAAAEPAAAPAALAAVLDEALALIARHAPAPDGGPAALPPALPAPPLPSLLDRCAALVAAADAAADPDRVVLAADAAAAGTAARLLALIPNLRVLAEGIAGADAAPADPAAAAGRAADAAARAAAWRARGLRMVRIRPLDAGVPAGARAAAVMRHPAALWLDALAAGRAAPSPEAQAAAAARALDALPGHVPVLMREAAEADPASALATLAAALALPLPADAGAAADRLAPPPPRRGPPLAWAGGAPATDAPLDGPAYAALCARLGCDPARLDAIDGGGADGALPPPPAGRLAAAPGRRPARLGPTLDRLLRLAAEPPAAPAPPPDAAALVATLDACLADPDAAPEAIDAAAAAMPPRDAALFLIAAAAHRAAAGDTLLALDHLADAEDALPPDAPAGAAVAGAEVYLRLGRPKMALALLARAALAGPAALPDPLRAALETAIHGPQRTGPDEHGHVLLMDHLAAAPPAAGPDPARPGPRLMVEIGTTRERVPGQGSTEKLARFCAARGIDFVTVDMDPRNAARAQRLFRRTGLPFRAEAAKGEDWLAAFAGTIDYVFLDAYDFDHGQHSAQRQSRYRTFLGAPIDEAACHRMHLDCAAALVTRLAPDGLICIDDTWTDAAGRWTAKGTTAVPFLLDRGFRLVEARNRAVLLARA